MPGTSYFKFYIKPPAGARPFTLQCLVFIWVSKEVQGLPITLDIMTVHVFSPAAIKYTNKTKKIHYSYSSIFCEKALDLHELSEECKSWDRSCIMKLKRIFSCTCFAEEIRITARAEFILLESHQSDGLEIRNFAYI